MSLRHRISVAGVLAIGVIAILAIGASGASAVSVTGQPVAFKAFIDNGFDGALVGVNGGVVNAECSGKNLDLRLTGTASNGLAKSNYNDGAEFTESDDDLDTGQFIPLNNFGADVIGHAEFTNGQNTRTMTVNYATEDGGVGPGFTRSDCAVWGSAIKGIY